MPDPAVRDRVEVAVHLDQSAWSTHLAEETLRGLRDDPPWIPPVWFYDDVGSALFDAITRLPEYYPTEAERSILTAHATDIARLTGASTLGELGSGTSDKTRLLIEALRRQGTLEVFAPFDCSEDVLRAAAVEVAGEHPGLAVDAIVGDFHEHLDALPTEGRLLLAFLGSTIGNFEPDQRRRFLDSLGEVLGPDDWFLLGTDLVKSTDRLVTAYDDPAGVTAAFNLNCLRVMNAELGADFDPDAYRHRAHWDATGSRIEMHLVATSDQRVHVAALEGLDLELREGEHLRTEISTKFTREQVDAELAEAGFAVAAAWCDDAGDFRLTLAHPT